MGWGTFYVVSRMPVHLLLFALLVSYLYFELVLGLGICAAGNGTDFGKVMNDAS